MRKLAAVILSYLLICAAASAEIIDFSVYTDQQLLEIRAELEKEIFDRSANETSAETKTTPNELFCDSAYTYTKNTDNTVTLCGYSWDGFTSGDDLIIPSVLDGCTVTAIASHSFERNAKIKIGTLSIPDSVKSIEREAFWELEANHIFIPSGIETVEQGAFVVIFNSISVENGSADYTVVDNALYEKSSKTLLASAHSGIVILDGIKTVGDYAFYSVKTENESMSVIPESVERIGSYAFYKADMKISAKQKYHIPAFEIGDYAFSDCVLWNNDYSDCEITFHPDLKIIPNGCFCGASTKVNRYVKYWSNSSFEYKNTYALYNKACAVYLPDGLLTIGDDAFKGFGSVKKSGFSGEEFGTVKIVGGFPSGLESIGSHCFEKKGILLVESEPILSGNASLKLIGDSAFNGVTLASSEKNDITISIPESMLCIQDHAFCVNSETGEHTIRIPATIQDISKEAFNKEHVLLEVDYGSFAEKWAKENAYRYKTISNNENDLSWLNS